MSGIPTIVKWATLEVNYPAGGNPWNATPVLVGPVGDIFTPNTKPPAQNFNYLFNKSDTQAQTAYNLAISAAISNWSQKQLGTGLPSLPGTFQNFVQFGWDTNYYRWVACVSDLVSGNHAFDIYYSVDGGRTWALQLGGVAGAVGITALSMCVGNFGNNVIVVIQAFSTGGSVMASAVQGGTITSATLGAMTGANAATCFVLGNNFWTYFAQQTGATFTANFYRGTNDGLTWLTETASLPGTNWQSGTNHVGPILSAVGTVASTATAVIAICGVTPASGDQARLLKVTQSAGVPTTADITPGTQLPAGTIIKGLAFGANDGLWALATFDGSNYHLYTSPDLVTWTSVQLFSSASISIGVIGIAAVGSVWAISAPASYGTNRIFISSDVASNPAGTVWHPTCGDIGVVSDGLGGLYSSGNQLVAASDPAVIVSGMVGFA